MSGLGGLLREVKTIGGVNQVSWGPALGQRQYKGQLLLLSSLENIIKSRSWVYGLEIPYRDFSLP